MLYRGVFPLREDRLALALFTSTQLPLVVAITTLAVQEGHMRASTAAALVGAGALSTLAGPLHGLHMRRSPRSSARPSDRKCSGRSRRAGSRVTRAPAARPCARRALWGRCGRGEPPMPMSSAVAANASSSGSW